MNCTVCGKDVDEHEEGRSCDRCVAEKLGWRVIDVHSERGLIGLKDGQAYDAQERFRGRLKVPHYSSPTMSAETWSLLNGMMVSLHNIDDNGNWDIEITQEGKDWIIQVYDAPTPTLAICRAFLATENDA